MTGETPIPSASKTSPTAANESMAEEGGRTSRGSLGLMQAYVKTLNDLHAAGRANLEEVEAWWIDRVRAFFASEGPKFHFDPGKSLNVPIILTPGLSPLS